MNILTSNSPETVLINWCVTSRCNFRCRYCPPDAHNGKADLLAKAYWPPGQIWPPQEKPTAFIKMLMVSSPVFVELVGGETTIWPGLTAFLEQFRNNKNIAFELLSNGSRSLRWWRDFTTATTGVPIFASLSFHAEQVDMEHFIQVFEILSNTHTVNVNVLLDPEYADICNAVYSRVAEKINNNMPGRVGYTLLRYDIGGDVYDGYTDEMLENIMKPGVFYWLDEAPAGGGMPPIRPGNVVIPTKVYINGEVVKVPELILNKKNNFKGWKCEALNKRFMIGTDGNLFPCNELHHDPMINLYESSLEEIQSFLKNNKFVICPSETCSCKWDVVVPKTQI